MLLKPGAAAAPWVCTEAIVVALIHCASAALADDPLARPETAIRVTQGSRTHEGLPLVWDDKSLFLLRPDGRIREFSVPKLTHFEQAPERFRPIQHHQLAAELRPDYSTEFEISATGHYVIVHPRGTGDKWASPFERLYGQFTHYFRVRGFPLEPPPFPLVVIVCRNQQEFVGTAERQGISRPELLAGYYSPMSNRVVTFDQPGRGAADDWTHNRATLVHEALHQFAFNTGIHQRWSPPSRWMVEGLAVMFEAPGVNDCQSHADLADRVHPHIRAQLDVFQKRGQLDGVLAQLVASDQLFSTDPDLAYAASWGLCFMLSETQPKNLARLLRLGTDRPPFTAYAPADRTRHFAQAVSPDLRLFESQLQRFISKLPDAVGPRP